jgi:hypothetical protein
MVECAMEGRGYWGDWPRPKGNSGGLFPIGKSPLEYEQLPRPFITPPSTKAVVHKSPWVPARVLVGLFPLRNSTTEPGRGGVFVVSNRSVLPYTGHPGNAPSSWFLTRF